MAFAKTLQRILLAGGILAGMASLPTRAAEDPAKPAAPATKSGERDPGGSTAALDYVKNAVDELKLNEEVQKKMEALFADAAASLKALDPITDPEGAKKKSAAVFDKLRKDMGELLTTEQKLQIQKKLVGMQTFLTIDKIKKQLDQRETLTAEQKKQVDDVLDETKRKLKEIQADSKNGGKDMQIKMLGALKDMGMKLHKILPPEGSGGGAAPKSGN